jgi:membrane protease YdiL (CAAX protease family)
MLAVVILLILSYIWVWKGSFPGAGAVLSIVLAVALIITHLQRGESLHDLGLRSDTASKALALLTPIATLIIAATVLTGNALGSAHFPAMSEAAAPIAKAVAFGFAQQYVLLAFFHRRFEQMVPSGAQAVLATAAVFALFHLPNPFLTAVTFVAGFIAATVYRHAPNLWINGVFHGLISYCLYYALSPDVTGGLRVGPGYWAR